MNNFNIGDWVNFENKYESFNPFKLEPKHFDFPPYWWESIKRWEPQEGEWCWFRSENTPKHFHVLAQFKEIVDGMFNKEYSIIYDKEVEESVGAITFSECIPFIGELPIYDNIENNLEYTI